ncbi:hypothetical protein BCV69DRAFT_297389 [Microstroma glucosiphilum]|uniref:Uncharacterized protein n=1 Tax=Pseudomicrostroma glucosiphilum TaxID=1684307 RepID=A0A316UA88_9BASI|nr:hypothetical protein BCV69DRAFT_297389 [Pseudomicrostroma glucosiphilum]PWN22082.1 hypothetical protein BCV69DRAFT_297389 [Pseudomicrostroma glucosiphilum]
MAVGPASDNYEWSQTGNDSAAILSKPTLTFKQATLDLLSPAIMSPRRHSKRLTWSGVPSRSASPASTTSSACVSSVQNMSYSTSYEANASDYFSIPISHNGLPTATPQSYRSYEDAQMVHLMDDAAIMLAGSASRWKRVAVTMPRSFWKAEDDASASSCDHLLSSACEKPFGQFLAGYRVPAFVKTVDADKTGSGLLDGFLTTNKRNTCWRCGNCFCDDHTTHYATLLLDEADSPATGHASRRPSQETSISALAALEEEAEQLSLVAAAEVQGEPEATTDTSSTPLPTAASALAHCLQRSTHNSPKKHSPEARRASSTVSSSLSSDACSGTSAAARENDQQYSLALSNLPAPGRRDSGHNTSPSIWHGMAQRDAVATSAAAAALVSSSSASSSRSHATTSSHGTSVTDEQLAQLPKRITLLPNGRYLVREKVCDRCSNIVEQERAKTVQRQGARRQSQEDTAAIDTLAAIAHFVEQYNGDAIPQQSQHTPRETRPAKPHHQQQQRSISSDSLHHRRGHSGAYPTREPRRNTSMERLGRPAASRLSQFSMNGNTQPWAAREDDRDDDDGEEDETSGERKWASPALRSSPFSSPSLRHATDDHYFPSYLCPSEAGSSNAGGRRAAPARAPQEPVMGGQRLKFAMARFQH